MRKTKRITPGRKLVIDRGCLDAYVHVGVCVYVWAYVYVVVYVVV